MLASTSSGLGLLESASHSWGSYWILGLRINGRSEHVLLCPLLPPFVSLELDCGHRLSGAFASCSLWLGEAGWAVVVRLAGS